MFVLHFLNMKKIIDNILWGLNELKHAKFFVECLGNGVFSVNDIYYECEEEIW